MDFLPQGSLAAKMAAGPMKVAEALQLTEQCAEVVGYLHRQGVVHGNLKPTNVLLAADGIPRISDIWPTASRLAEANASADADVESVNLVEAASLWAYVAPELIESAEVEVRPTVDVYGLGAILYGLLTGRAPFTAGRVVEMLQQVRSDEPTAPSALNPDVPPDVDDLVLKCLRKNPWLRFVRAYHLNTRLRRLRVQLGGKGTSGDGRRSRR
jgi:serine/threonine protein kinase